MLTDLRIYLLTWNVVGRPPIEDLHATLGLDEPVDPSILPDIYIIGLQEVSMKPQDLIVDVLFSDPWLNHFKLILHRWDYVKFRHIRMQGIMLMAFCKRDHLIHLRGVQTDYTRTGLGGIWGNKGGASIRFSIRGCSVCVVNSHLASGDEYFTHRIEDYNNIMDRQKFVDPQTNSILSHDYVFWIGDLNFRINKFENDEVMDLMSAKNYSELFEMDQLKEAMESGLAFSEFTETPPPFPPTYKYEVDGTSFDCKRKPAWTDRVLFRYTKNAYTNVSLDLKQNHYSSHPQYLQSDHKPVSSSFTLQVFDKFPQTTVQFFINTQWQACKDTVAIYMADESFVPSTWDWIGLFPARFMSTEDHIGYVWASTRPLPAQEAPCETKNMLFYKVIFSDPSLLIPGIYRLLYIHNQFEDVLGMSNTFEIVPD